MNILFILFQQAEHIRALAMCWFSFAILKYLLDGQLDIQEISKTSTTIRDWLLLEIHSNQFLGKTGQADD